MQITGKHSTNKMLIAQTLLILSTKSVKNIFRVFVKYVNYQKCTLLWTFTGAVQMCRWQVMNPFRQYSCGSAWWRGGEECCYKINKVVPLSRRFISFRLDKNISNQLFQQLSTSIMAGLFLLLIWQKCSFVALIYIDIINLKSLEFCGVAGLTVI